MDRGRVYLVGAGPGDEKLITLRGIELVRQADVVVYDRLATPKILAQIKEGAELIYAGKQSGRHTLKQHEINAVLVQKAKEGKLVVRLKGGDVFIFGRGGEEAEALFEAGVPFEIVPGISSFYGALAYAGIPVTHRRYASSFHVYTGHEEGELDFAVIAKNEGTLVFMMGMENLGRIVDGLLRNGKPADTPAALVQWGTTGRQREAFGRLDTLTDTAADNYISSPAVIVVGDAVEAHHKVQWQIYRKLWGKRILLTRTREQSGEIYERLYNLGASVTEFPTIRIGPAEDSDADCEMKNLQQYHWLFFTSVNGVNFFFERLKDLHIDIRRLGHLKIFCIGKKTEDELARRGVLVDLMPEAYNSIESAKLLVRHIRPGERILCPTSSIHSTSTSEAAQTDLGLMDHSSGGGENKEDPIREAVMAAGALFRRITVYTNQLPRESDKEILHSILQDEYDAIVFSSSSQVNHFVRLTQKTDYRAKICSIGPVTTKAVQAQGMRVDITAQNATIDSLVAAIENVLTGDVEA